MKKMNKLSPILLILILSLETLTFARNYQVARVQGVITKIRGKRVRVQDNKNQIYWVDRQDVIPRRSQIYDKVNFYRKVRFKSSYTPKTTSFLLKHRKKKMIQTLRKFMVNHEKEYGYRSTTKKRKRTTSLFHKLKSFLQIEKAHATPSPISSDICYIGGWKGHYSTTSNHCYIGSVAKESSCGEKDSNGISQGFRCNPDLFPNEKTTEQELCISRGKNETQRCYAAYKKNSQGSSALVKKNVLNDLASDYSRAGDLEDLQASFDQIIDNCNIDNNKKTEPLVGACYGLRKDLEEITEGVLGKVNEKKNERQQIINEAQKISNEKARQQIATILQQYKYQPQQSPIFINPKQQQQQQVIYQILAQQNGSTGYQPTVRPGFNPAIINQYQRPGQGVVVIVLPQNIADQIRNGQGSVVTQQEEEIKKLNERIKQLEKNKATPEEIEEVVEQKTERELQLEAFQNLGEIANFAYSESIEECEKIGKPELCFVKDGESYKAYSQEGIGYEEVIDKIEVDASGSVKIDGNLVSIEDLGENTDPTLNWECDVFKDMEAQACSIGDVQVPVMHISCREESSDIKTIGYLSPEKSQEISGLFGSSDTAKFNYRFDGVNKKTRVTQPEDIIIDFDNARVPKSYVNKCSNDEDQLSTVDFNKSCQLDEGFTPINCPHCTPKEAPQQTKCVANLRCEAEYKDSFNRQASGDSFEFKAVCDCEITDDEEGIVSDKNSCQLPINNQSREPEDGYDLGADDTAPGLRK